MSGLALLTPAFYGCPRAFLSTRQRSGDLLAPAARLGGWSWSVVVWQWQTRGPVEGSGHVLGFSFGPQQGLT